ncbi:hypothetical protein GS456_15715 [Rhodococcus hoagii]|nr:hypothetical protein [Prescottella equi]
MPWLLKQIEDEPISRPGVLAWAATVNVVGALVLFAWVAYAGRRHPVTPTAARSSICRANSRSDR